MRDYIKVSALTLLRFQLACRAGENDLEALIPIKEFWELVEAVKRKTKEQRLFIAGGRVYVDDCRMEGIKPHEADFLEALQESGGLTLEESFRYFPAINPDLPGAYGTLRSAISRLNRNFDDMGIAVLANGSGIFKIYER